MITDLPKYIGIFILILTASIVSHAQTYYWVGNGGNWNDANNWSAGSGEVGGIGIPTAGIDVVFDSGSGNCVIGTPASCASITMNTAGTITVNELLIVSDTLLHNSGDLILNQRVETGSYISTSTSNRSVSGTNVSFYINGEPGSFIVAPTNYLSPEVDTLIFFSTNATLESGGATVIDYLEFKANGEVYGDNQMNLGVFSNGYSVFLENGSVQTIYDEIITGDFCDGLAIISAFLTDPATATLRWESNRTPFPRGFYFRRIRGEDIVNGRANDVRYSDGVDGGDNDNISINTGNEVPQRTLYWVGGSGTWRDRTHWSLTSGGAGGECIPTAKDIVNFDNNSFNGPGDLVSSNAEVYISEFNYTSSSLPGIFNIPALNIRRSLNLQQPLIWDIPTVNLVGVDNTVDLTLTTSNNVLNDMNVISLRNVTLKDNLNLNGTLNFENFNTSARFRSFGFDINVGRFIADGSEMGLDLANSYIMVNSLLANGTLDMPLTIRNSEIISTNNTRWELTASSSGFEVSGMDLGSVWFSEPDGDAFAFGTGEVLLQSLRFEGNGRIFQENYIIDSLIFTPGHSYTAEADKEIAVNFYFESLGDLCQPISFESNASNQAANLFMPASATVSMTYNNIENIHASGGNSFDAGVGSIDRGGNVGWSFRDPNAVDRNEFLGPDTLFCNDLQGSFRIFLDYSLDEVDSVQFNNGLTEPFDRSPYVQTFPVNGLPAQSFDVVARLVFDNGCFALDTITVTIDESFNIDIGSDQTICNTDSITLQNLNGEQGVSYTWNDGSDLESLTVSTTGTYTVIGQRGACTAQDEVNITKIDLSELSIGNDTILCEVENLTLKAPSDFSGEITWSTGSKESSINVIKSDIFWADFTQDICTYRDSIDVRIETSFDIDLGADTTLCNGASLVLNTGTDSGTFQWSNGETAPLITVSEQGTYSVNVQIGTCMASDTIEIEAIALKSFSLGADTTICQTDPYSLSVPNGFQGSFSWSTGESTEDITTTVEGAYSLTLSEDICEISDTIVISIDPQIDLNLGSDTTLCTGDILTLRSGIAEADSYSWSTGETTESITVAEEGTYTVIVERGTCTATDDIVVSYINVDNFSIGSDTTLCVGETLLLSADLSSNATYQWQDGSTDDTFLVDQGGNFRVVANLENCSTTADINVSYQPALDINLGEDTTLCGGASLTLNTGLDSGIFRWSTGQTAPLITVSDNGTYSVDVEFGVCTTRDTININTVDLKPFSLGQDTTLCETEALTLSTPDGFTGSFEWSTGESANDIDVSSNGTYSLTISEDICEFSDTINVSFDPAIMLDLGVDTTLCTGETLNISAGVTDASMYLWNTGETSETITVANADTYSVIVERGKCTSTDEIEISYINVDNFSIGADTTLCEGETLVLSADLSSAATYQWQDNSTNDTFLVSQAGRYSVVANLENCAATAEINVNYQTPIDVDLGEDITLCEPNAIVLDASRDGATYLWQDGSTDPTILAATSDIYVVTVNDAACTVQDSIVVTIQDLPNISIASTDELELCDGDSIVLSAFANGVSYVWQDLSTSPEYIAKETGLYFAEMRLGVCVVRDSIDIIFNPNPVVALRADTTICEGTSVTLNLPELTDAEYNWTGISSTEAMVTISQEGTYQGTVTSDKGCMSSDEFTLSVNPTPVFDLGNDVAVCDGDPAVITAQPSFPNMMWNVAGSGSSITTTTEGLVIATADLAGCVFSDSVNVTVQSYPVVELGSDTVICERSELILSAETPGASYTWNTGASTPTVAATGSGTFIVDVNLNGCITTDQINIETKETPDFELAADRTICEDEDYTIAVSNPGNWDVSWSSGEMTDDILVSESGTYTATATIDGCSSSDDFVLSIQPLPEFDLGETIRKCEDLSTILTVDRNDVEVVWQDGTIGNSITASDPGLYTAVAMTSIGCTFTDEVEVENRECVNFTIYIPNAFSPNGDNQNDEYITAIPEGTFLNAFEMRIFDRWGNQIFQSNDINVPWLGNGGGFTSLQPGVYAYVIKLNYSDDYVQGIDQTYKGNITLIE